MNVLLHVYVATIDDLTGAQYVLDKNKARRKAMYHKIAQKAADTCINKKWISIEHRNWCVYAFEKRIIFCAIFVFLMFIAILTNKIIETFTFWGSITMLRRRIGGWHAKDAWSCQLISIGSVLIVLFAVGPVLEQQHLGFIIFFDAIVLLASLFIRPQFPPQLHFSEDIIKANNNKKNRIVLLIIVIQILGTILECFALVIYSTLGISLALTALVAERYTVQRKEK